MIEKGCDEELNVKCSVCIEVWVQRNCPFMSVAFGGFQIIRALNG